MRLSDASGPDAPSIDALAREVQEALARGDRDLAAASYEAIVVRLQRRASRLAFWHLRNADEADELVQDTFLKVFERIDRYRADLPFEAWFTSVLVNGCLDRGRAATRRGRWQLPGGSIDDWADRVSSSEPTPERRVLDAERHGALSEAIARLPERQRTVVLLSQLDERSSAEVGEMIGVSESTVRVHLFRALRRLRSLMEDSDAARERLRPAR